MQNMSNATSWYPYLTHRRREPHAAPVHDIALKEALVLPPIGSVHSISWQSMALTGRALEGPVTVEYWSSPHDIVVLLLPDRIESMHPLRADKGHRGPREDQTKKVAAGKPPEYSADGSMS